MRPKTAEEKAQVQDQRWELLHHLVCLTCTPMTVLSFVWVGLIIANFLFVLPPWLQMVSTVIWAIFILDFLLQFIIAPHKLTYLKGHWLTAISLALPAFSMLRILQALRIVRLAAVSGSFSLLRIVTACNRGMMAARRALGHRKLGYIATLTLIVTLVGAAGMYAFENPAALRAQGFGSAVHGGAGLHSYPEALWWTAMIMTTIGSSYFPISLPGRILCWLLALYALSIFGYITATIASYFLGDHSKSADQQEAPAPNTTLSSLEVELKAMREQLSTLLARFDDEAMPDNVIRETRLRAGEGNASTQT